MEEKSSVDGIPNEIHIYITDDADDVICCDVVRLTGQRDADIETYKATKAALVEQAHELLS